MSKELMISSNRHETRVAMVEDDQVVEIFHQRENEYSLAGSIHKGRVTRVLPGMQSAFVDIGLDRDAFLYVSDFFEDNEEYDKIVTSVEEKVFKRTERAARFRRLRLTRSEPIVEAEARKRKHRPKQPLRRRRLPSSGPPARSDATTAAATATGITIAAVAAAAVDAADKEEAAVGAACRIPSFIPRGPAGRDAPRASPGTARIVPR